MYALKLHHSSKHIDLGKKSLPITMNNPIFDPESLERVFSYSMNVPASPTNNHYFSHAYRLDSAGKKTFDAELIISDQRFEVGQLVITKSTPDNYTIVFRSKGIDLVASLKELNLRDLEMPEKIGFYDELSFDFAFSTQLPGSSTASQFYMCEVDGEIIISGVVDGVEALVSKINSLANISCTLIGFNGSDQFFINISAVDPEIPVYINTTPDTSSLGLLEQGIFMNLINFTGDEEQTNVKMHAAWSAHFSDVNISSPSHRFPMLRFVEDPYDGKNEGFENYANYVHPNGSLLLNFPNPEGVNGWRYSVIPFTFLKHVLEVIAAKYNYEFAGDLFEDVFFQKVLLGSNVTLDDVKNEFIPGIVGNEGYSNVYRYEYNLADHLPDISAFDLLQVVIKAYGAGTTIKDNKIFLRTSESILSQPAKNWTKKVSPKWQKSFTDTKGLSVDFDRQGNTEDYGNPTRKVTITEANDTTPLQYNVGFMFYPEYRGRDEVIGGELRRDILVPYTKDKIHSPGLTEAETRIRLTRWISNTSGSSGGQYPFATYGQYIFNGFVGGDPLHIDGSTGLYQKRLKRLLSLLRKGDVVTIPVKLTIADLLELKKWNNPRRHFFTEDGSVTCVVKSVRFNVSQTGISTASVTLIKE